MQSAHVNVECMYMYTNVYECFRLDHSNVDRPLLLRLLDVGSFNGMEEPVGRVVLPLQPEVLEGEGVDSFNQAGSKRRKTKASRPNNSKF